MVIGVSVGVPVAVIIIAVVAVVLVIIVIIKNRGENNNGDYVAPAVHKLLGHTVARPADRFFLCVQKMDLTL